MHANTCRWEIRQQSNCSLPPTKKRKMPWVPSLDLTIYDKKTTESETGLLCGNHMTAANNILAHQSPNLQGLQSTLLSQTNGFSPISVESNAGYIPEAASLQFFFEPEREHWVATAYIDGQVQLYDSIFTGNLSTCLTKQICQVYQNAVVDESLIVAVVAVQQQTGTTECGVMAIANGYHATCGDDLSKVSFIPKKMREHLSRCMKNKLLTPFPVETAPDKARMEETFKYINIEVSCECKRPDTYQNIIACDGCDSWLHMCWTK